MAVREEGVLLLLPWHAMARSRLCRRSPSAPGRAGAPDHLRRRRRDYNAALLATSAAPRRPNEREFPMFRRVLIALTVLAAFGGSIGVYSALTAPPRAAWARSHSCPDRIAAACTYDRRPLSERHQGVAPGPEGPAQALPPAAEIRLFGNSLLQSVLMPRYFPAPSQ